MSNSAGLVSFSTTISPVKTAGEIQQILVDHGATHLMITYAEGSPVDLSFSLPTPFGPRGFRLPVDVACGTDDGNWQQHPCPTRRLTAEIRGELSHG